MKMASGELRQVVDLSDEEARKPADEETLEDALDEKKDIHNKLQSLFSLFGPNPLINVLNLKSKKEREKKI